MSGSALREASGVLFERAFVAAPIGKALVDLEGICIRVNPALDELLLADDNGLTGTSVEDVVELSLLDRPMAPNETFEEERAVRRADGTTLWLHVSVAVVHQDDEELVGYVVQFQDVTERRRLKDERALATEQLVRSNRELEEFAAVASHDLQEPLRKIRAFADRLATRHGDRLGEGIDDLTRIQDAAGRMQVLIDDVLAYSRLDRRSLSTDEVEVATLVRESLAQSRPELDAVGACVEVGALPVVPGDAGELRQVVDNVLSNALKFRRPDEPLRIHIFEDAAAGNGRTAIVFEDNGIGFKEQYGEKVFSIFERLHGRTEYPGTGIGLAICRKIIERHGGTIRAEGTPGRGARLVITLPRSDASTSAEGAPGD